MSERVTDEQARVWADESKTGPWPISLLALDLIEARADRDRYREVLLYYAGRVLNLAYDDDIECSDWGDERIKRLALEMRDGKREILKETA